jgi:hypothetical protein
MLSLLHEELNSLQQESHDAAENLENIEGDLHDLNALHKQ